MIKNRELESIAYIWSAYRPCGSYILVVLQLAYSQLYIRLC